MDFARNVELMLDAESVERLLSAHAMRGGKEHRVAFLQAHGRFLKTADAHALATETVYDYLTDLLYSNHFFVDDIHFLGCYPMVDHLQIVTSQPYMDGTHPDWPELKRRLVHQGLKDPYPRSLSSAFNESHKLHEYFNLNPEVRARCRQAVISL